MFSDNTTKSSGIVKVKDVEKGSLNEPKKIRGPVLETSVNLETGDAVPVKTCRQWTVLDGNFRFLFDGRLMFGPGCCFFWWAIIIHLTSTLIVFLCFEIYPYLRPDRVEDYILPLLIIFLSIASICSIFQIVLTEPGYIPRLPLEKQARNLLNYFVDKRPGQNVHKKEVVNGEEVVYTFCETCAHFRPPRALHCEVCNVCIERYDHHCKIFGTCIGRRNYGAFFRFIVSTNVLILIVGAISVTNLISHSLSIGFSRAVGKSPTIWVLLIAVVIPPFGIIQLFWLMSRHLYFTMTDQTCYENKNNLAPMDERKVKTICAQGLTNVYTIALRPPPRSQINPRLFVKAPGPAPVHLKRLQGNISKYNERKSRTVYSCPNGALSKDSTKRKVVKAPKGQFLQRLKNITSGCARMSISRPVSGRVFPENLRNTARNDNDNSIV